MKLRDARINASLTQEDVVRFVDVSVRHYQDIEAGKRIPNVVLALDICELFLADLQGIDEWQSSFRPPTSRPIYRVPPRKGLPYITLKDSRVNASYTQEDVVRYINVSVRHYQDIEAGKKIPGVVLALELCKLFNVDPRCVEEWQSSLKPPRLKKGRFL